MARQMVSPIAGEMQVGAVRGVDADGRLLAAAAFAAAAYQYYQFHQRNHLSYFAGLISAGMALKTFSEGQRMISDVFIDSMNKGDVHRPCIEFVDEATGRSARVLSYKQVNDLSNKIAHWAHTELKLKRGDVVALLMTNRPEYIAIWLGLSKLGCVTALINTNLLGKGLQHCIKISNAKHTIISDDLMKDAYDVVSPLSQIWCFGDPTGLANVKDLTGYLIRNDDASEPPASTRVGHVATNPLIYIYTSGTTGLPKAAIISHLRFFLMTTLTSSIGICGTDTIYTCLPLYHSAGGVLGVGALFQVSCKMVLAKKFKASRFWEDCAAFNVTVIQYIGELFRYLVSTPAKASDKQHKVRLAVGNGLRPDIWATVLKRFGEDIKICEFYGSTEGNVGLMNAGFRVGAIGFMPRIIDKVNPAQIIRFDTEKEEPIRDAKTGFCLLAAPNESGELISKIAGDLATRFDGYVGQKDVQNSATEKKILRDVFVKGDAYFRSGDLLRRDADGYYYFVDRIGDTFRWKGENVSTNEVQEAINVFPNIQECNVYGVAVGPSSDGKGGMANIVLLDASKDVNMSDFYKHVCDQLPSYARPIFLRFSKAVEITGTFKHRKVELAKEGFDPSKCPADDKIFVISNEQKTYLPLSQAAADKIMSTGEIRN